MAEPENSQILKAIEEIGKQSVSIGEKLTEQDARIKETGSTGAKLASTIKSHDDLLEQAKADLAGLKQNLVERDGVVKALTDRLEQLEMRGQRGAAGYGAGLSDAELNERKSLGEKFAEIVKANRDKFMEAYQNRKFDGTPSVQGASFFHGSPAAGGYGIQKAMTTAETANFSPTYVRTGMVELPSRELRIRDLMSVVPVTENNIRYTREKGFGLLTTTSVTSITSAGTVATATTSVAHGWKLYDIVLIAGATVAAFNGAVRIMSVPTGSTFTYTIADQSNASASGTLTALRLNNWGAAAAVAELGLKPQASMRFEEATATVEVIAHYVKASQQVIDDVPRIKALIDNRLVYGLRRREEDYLLYGSGTSPQILGIMNAPGLMTYNWSAGLVGDTEMDAIRRAITITQIMDGASPTASVIHPIIWERIETAKDNENRYILMQSPQPGSAIGSPPVIWRLGLVVTPAIVSTEGVQGPWGTQSELYDRQAAAVRMADQNEDDFIYNRVTIRAEERIAAGWLNPSSFVKINFDSAPV